MELNETIRWKERRSSTCPVVLATNPSDAEVVIGSPFICGAAADLPDLQDRAFPLLAASSIRIVLPTCC